MKILFTAAATTTGGRNGHGESADGKVKVDFAVPTEMGGPGGAGLTPEHLFATGYSACFGSAVQLVATRHHQTPQGLSVTASVGMGRADSGGYGFQVELSVRMPGTERSVAETIVREAHAICPYSNAIRNNVPVELRVID